MNANTSNPSVDAYLNGRWKEQSSFFEAKAASNKKMFIWTRPLGFFAGIFTPIIIFVVALCVDPAYKSPFAHYYHLIPAVVSLIAVGSYQWEELHNYGAQWAKYRLVGNTDEADALRQFVEACEALIEGTDVNYFVLMVDPLRRQDQ